jgi:hypothetical protein
MTVLNRNVFKYNVQKILYKYFHFILIIRVQYISKKSRDNSVGIALGYGLDDRCSRVRFPGGENVSLHHRVQNGSGAHPASYPMGLGSYYSGGKMTGV